MTGALARPVVVAQVGGLETVVALLVLLVVVTSVASALEVVEEGDPRALLVSGEYQRVLEPGVVIYPPFVSRTVPIDVETMTVDTGQREVDVPREDHSSARAHGVDPESGYDH
jgi:SPFH domain / Band 7 family.